MAQNPLDKHYENLTKLYLRLKGYFVTNLIIHSDIHGESKSELDILAIRMPFHKQEYRNVNVPDLLECSPTVIEIIIGDVKNYQKKSRLKFNEGLRNNLASIHQLVDWIGIYKTISEEILLKFQKYLHPHTVPDLKGFAMFDENEEISKFRVKFTFFCPCLHGTAKVLNIFMEMR